MNPNTPSTRYSDALATVKARTAPSSAAVARVRARLDLQLAPTTDLLDHLPSPTSFQVARVRARLAGEQVPATFRPRWLLPLGGLALAGAAAAMVVGAPSEQVEPVSTVEITGGGSTAAVPEIDVAPTTAAGWLARARALEDEGAGNTAVLSAAESGLALPADAAIRSELEVARMGALLRSGRADEALSSAEAALAGAGPERAEELHRAAARLALAAGDCSRALPHLHALTAPTSDELAHAEHCSP
jgi:hypothetical protein